MTSFTDNGDLWRQDESLRHLAGRLSESPRTIRVVSFDFFDTLIYRLCAEPADLFIELGRRLAAAELLRQPLSPAQFRDIRVAADIKARRAAAAEGRSSEITLAAIHAQLGRVVWDVRASLELELQIERDMTCCNPSMLGLVRHVRAQGFRTAIISDTYFERDHILGVLRDGGVDPKLFDGLFLSSASGRAKWEGGLFREACRHFNIHPNELLHVGDNPHADVQMAAAVGAEPVLYYRTTATLGGVFDAERSYLAPGHPTAAGLHFVRTLAARMAESDQDAYYDGAFSFGPVLTRYADWCVQRFAAAGVRKVLALMREGELLGELVANAARAAKVPLEVVPCYVSRLSTARASMSDTSVAQIEQLLEGNNGLTLYSILEILGILEKARPHVAAELFTKPLATKESIRGVVQLLVKQPRLRELVESSRRLSHELAFSYLDRLTAGEPAIGIIDLGWSGSIQRNLSRILRQGGRTIRTTGCYLAVTKRAAGLFLDGDDALAYLDDHWTRTTILPEIAITACVGSTNGYTRAPDGEVVPVLGPFSLAETERCLKRRLREGVLSFQALWHGIRSGKGPTAISSAMLEDIDRQSAAIMYRLIDFPSPAEARRLGALNHDENYWGERLSRPLCSPGAGARLRAEGVQALFVNPDSYWPQGVVAQNQPRMIAALSKRWLDGLAFGRWGSGAAGSGEVSALNGDELGSLRPLLIEFAPQQSCFVGGSGGEIARLFADLTSKHGRIVRPADEGAPKCDGPGLRPANADSADESALWSTGENFSPRLLVVGSPALPGSSCYGWMRQVEGSPDRPETLRTARRALSDCRRIALILSAEIPTAALCTTLNGLAPFLGPEGLILLAHGAYDTSGLSEQHQGTQVLNTWLEKAGCDLGYELWSAPPSLRVHQLNWTVLVRRPASRESPAYWSLSLGELPLAGMQAPMEPALMSGRLMPVATTES